jgi:translation initiation factor IF-2
LANTLYVTPGSLNLILALLQAEIMNLKAPVDTKAEGIVIEARVDRGLGTVATLLVQKGTLRVGDVILAGPSWGKVRRIISDQGEDLKEAGPSTPVQVIGLSSIPSAGDTVTVTDSEAAAREVAEARQRLDRQSVGIASSATIASQATGLLDGSYDNREVIKVPIVIKADVSGSVEALISSINALELSDDTAICKPDIVFAGVGEVTTSDIALANVAKAKTYAFNVGANYQAMEEARANNIDIGYYNVVYDLLDELEAIIKNTLAPPPPGKLIGQAEIQKLFRIGKVGKIAGCKVTDGLIKMDSMVRVMRGKRNPIFVGKLSSLRVVKDVVQEVPEGSDCGLSVEDFQDFEEGDVIECFVGENADLNSDNY